MNTVYSNSNTDDDARREQLYSNQLRSTVPNTSGRTRLDIDFRTVHIQRIDEQIAVDHERAPASRS